MDNQHTERSSPQNPRRRKRSALQTFKEAYLPLIIAAAIFLVLILILVDIFDAKPSKSTSPTVPSTASSHAALAQEADTLLQKATALANAYDYDGALTLLSSFSGRLSDFPKLSEAIQNYTLIKHNMVAWTADQVPNLSFHVLVADLDAALNDPTYGKKGNNLYNRNFISTQEFSRILTQLHQNGYVLVSPQDVYNIGSANSEKELLLPAGKKPIMMTETHCNYYTYMVDSDDDNLPDKGGAGFASKLCYNGSFYNEMISSSGATITGDLDLVPILEAFIAQHPDFSYRGARAILAFSGYDGIFGYRVTSNDLTDAQLKQEKEDAAAVAQALRKAGYVLACYSYANTNYQLLSAKEIRADIEDWNSKIIPIIGQTNVMVFAREGDIGSDYSGNAKFDALYEVGGFRLFMGSGSFLYNYVEKDYIRHNRLLVTGSTLHHHADWFKGILDTSQLLESSRGAIPK